MGGKSRKAGQVSRKLIDRLKQGGSPPPNKENKKNSPALLPRESK